MLPPSYNAPVTEKSRNHSARSVQEIARGQPGMARALRMAEACIALNARLQPLLPAAAKGQVQVACIEGSTLMIACASSAWAARARMHAEALLDEARRHWPAPLEEIRVFIAPGMIADAPG